MNRLAVLVAVSLSLSAGSVGAATACRIGATGMAFGTYDIFTSVPNDSQASVVVTCARDGGPRNVTVTLAMTEGQHGNSINARRMANVTLPGEFLAYGLYTDTGRTTALGYSPGVNTLSRTLAIDNRSSASATFIIYGRLRAQQDAAVGTYSDLVQVTVTP